MHSASDNIEIMISDEEDKMIKKPFNSLKNRYQNNLELIRGSESVFSYVKLLYYKCHKINLNCGGSYIDSPDQLKSKKTTINPINKKDNKCLQYAVTVALNYEEIQKDLQRITKVKPFINKYNLKGINFPSEKMIGKNLRKIMQQQLLMFFMLKKEKMYFAYVSKYNSNREKQVILSMISNGEILKAKSKRNKDGIILQKKTISIIKSNIF